MLSPVSSENVPGGQGKHSSIADAPNSELYVPTGHFVHALSSLFLVSLLNVPAGQGMKPPLFEFATLQ